LAAKGPPKFGGGLQGRFRITPALDNLAEPGPKQLCRVPFLHSTNEHERD
jgi:hypothetical protein